MGRDRVVRDGAEWVVTGSGEEIRLDRLMAVDGIAFRDDGADNST